MALPIGLIPGLKAKTVVEREEDGRVSKAEYAATCLAHSVVYRLNGKAIKNAEVPQEVKEQLNLTMLVGAGTPTNVMPPELGIVSEPEFVGIDHAEVGGDKTVTQEFEPSNPLQEAVNQLANAKVEAQSTPAAPNPFYQPSVLEDNSIEDEFGFSEADAPQVDYEAMLQEAEARSVDAVNLRVLVKALYERFGVYTVYLNKTPSREDINPLTGAIMNSLTLGQANQGFRVAQRTGTSWNPEAIKAQLEAARQSRTSDAAPLPQSSMAASQAVEDAPFGREIEMPSIYGEPMAHPERRFNRSYESPHASAMYPERGKESDGTDPDEVYAEPPINSRNAIVRPFKTNRRSEDQLQRISSRRVVPENPVNFDDLV